MLGGMCLAVSQAALGIDMRLGWSWGNRLVQNVHRYRWIALLEDLDNLGGANLSGVAFLSAAVWIKIAAVKDGCRTAIIQDQGLDDIGGKIEALLIVEVKELKVHQDENFTPSHLYLA